VATDLFEQRGLHKIPLHQFSAAAQQGHYFQFPSQEMVIANTKEGFSSIKLQKIVYEQQWTGEGIHLPTL
jgi:hypothetical protein